VDRPTLQPEKMAAGGDAIARAADGKVVFVRGALPGERVAVEIVDSRKDFSRAVVVDVLEPSPARIIPPCPALAHGCGGCAWQHVDPAEQLRLKVGIATDALVRIGHLPGAAVRAGGGVPPFGYRTTLRLAVDVDGRVGLRAASRHDVVPLDDCLVAHPRLAELLPALRAGGDEVFLRVGVAGGERVAIGEGLRGLPPDVTVGRRAAVHEDVAGARLRVSAGSFFQSGPAAAELLVAEVGAAAGSVEAGTVDLYGGVGLFSAALRVPSAVVVESSSTACADARANLGDDAVVQRTTVEKWTPRRAPLVVADPARTGLGSTVVSKIAATKASRVVLVSCDAAALGRDAALLVDAGYAHGVTTVLDLFPNTPHLEAVTVFTGRHLRS
jgi:23S rRNA (uracil1939-C5)-methyltransferase